MIQRIDILYKTFIGGILFLILITLLQNPLYINWDVAMYLDIGSRILAGQMPYIDYYEINLPTIHYLSAIPVFIARTTGLSQILVLQLLVLGLTVWSAWGTYRLSRAYFGSERLFIVYVVPFVLTLHSLYAWSIAHYAQREHLFLLLFLPGLLTRLCRWEGVQPVSWPGALLYGMLAAIGVALKPYFALFPIVLESYWLLRHRTWRPLLAPEVIGFVLIAVLHLGYFILFPTITAGLLDILQLARTGYAAYGHQPWWSIITSQVTLFFLSIILLAWVVYRRTDTLVQQFVTAFVLLGLIGAIIFAIQAKGFLYHRLLLDFGVLLAIGFILQRITIPSLSHVDEHTIPEPSPRQTWLLVGMLTILTMLSILIMARDVLDRELNASRWVQLNQIILIPTIERYSEPGDHLLALDPGPTLSYPILLQVDRHQAASYTYAFPFLMSYYGMPEDQLLDPTEPIPPAMQQFLDVTAQDIQQQPPLIIIQNGYARMFDYLEVRGFIQQHVEPHYTLVEANEQYVIYRRNDLDAHSSE